MSCFWTNEVNCGCTEVLPPAEIGIILSSVLNLYNGGLIGIVTTTVDISKIDVGNPIKRFYIQQGVGQNLKGQVIDMNSNPNHLIEIMSFNFHIPMPTSIQITVFEYYNYNILETKIANL